MKQGEAPSVVEVQHQIRANASQLQDYFSDLYAWEKNIGKEDSARKRAVKTMTRSIAETPPPRKAGGGNLSGSAAATGDKQPGAHTYDKGYKRWEKFDVDAALKEADGDGDSKQTSEQELTAATSSPSSRRVAATSQASSSSAPTKSREELEKEEGNAHYKRGDYVAAIKSYTRCLGYNPHNTVVLSNRAMAYLKNREFANAEDDCTLALKADSTHVKSYSRRATARNSLGKHRLALLDFHRAAALDPKSRQIQIQQQSTRELIRIAIKRSPKRTKFSIEIVGESSSSKPLSPEQDSEANEDKENLGSQQSGTQSQDVKPKPLPLQESSSVSLPQPPPRTAEGHTSTEKKKKKSPVILPKLPQKVPATSYEFGRVWKTLALRGDVEQKTRLLSLRADYLRMIDPPTLRSVFKTAIETDVLCEMFHVLRYAVLCSDSEAPKDNLPFVLGFASEVTKVPRFSMTIMLLSDTEKEDMTWVITRLDELVKDGDESQERNVAELKKLYELP